MCKKQEFGFFNLTVHHIKSRKRGGRDTINNLISLCEQCHNIAELEQLTKKEIQQYDLYKETKIKEKQ